MFSRERGNLPTDFVLCVSDFGKDAFLVGTYGEGILEIDALRYSVTPLDWESARDREIVDMVRCIRFDSSGRLWIGTFHKGLVMAERSSAGKWRIARHYYVENSEMPNYTINSIAYNVAGNEIAVATPTGMAVVNANTLELKNIRAAKGMFIQSLEFFDGKWWAGRSSGLSYIDLRTDTAVSVDEIDDSVIALVSDNAGTLYAVSYDTVWIIKRMSRDTYNVIRKKLGWLPTKEGLVPHAASTGADGTLYAGCAWGYVEFPPGSDAAMPHRPVRFMGVTAGGHIEDYSKPLPVGLPLEVWISDLTYWGDSRYEYSLDGGAWSAADNGLVHLGTLRPGFYELKVRHKGHFSEAYSLRFQVGEWWNHWLFVTFVWLAGIAAVVLAFLYIWHLFKTKKPFEVRAVPVESEEDDSPDSQFLRKVAQVVEASMSEEGFGVEQLASAIGMSRTTLFRKVKALTGQTPFDLIQGMRLERGKELLTRKKQSVQDVAWAVGMNPRQFSSAYKKRFGHAPSRPAEK